MSWRTWLASLAICCIGGSLDGQALAKNVVATDGLVQVIYPSRASACGDGVSFIGNVFNRHQVYMDDAGVSGRNDWRNAPCVHGPARVLATVINGEVTRVRAFVGPVASASSDVRTVTANAADASSWLDDLVAHAPARVASQAVLPLMLADAAEPWPRLLEVARDDSRPREVRRSTMQWLATGVTERLGLGDVDERGTDADEMRTQAVFVLSQRPKNESVPELIDIVRSGKQPASRKAAIFWLGQSGDSRAIDVYAELLGVR